MLNHEERQAAEIEDLRKQRDEYASEKQALEARLKDAAYILNMPVNNETDDVAAFGRGAWVYCNQHMKPHPTGWCSVSPRDKVGLGVKDAKEAYAKCEAWGFTIYDPNKK